MNKHSDKSGQCAIDLPPYPAPHSHTHFCKSGQRCLFYDAAFLFCLIAAAYLSWPSNPIVAVGRRGLDRLHINTRTNALIDMTLNLTVMILNTAFYSMDYDPFLVAIGYRGKQLGFVTSDGGHMKVLDLSYVNATLQLERVEVLTDVDLLIEDLARGAITFDTETEIGGKLDVFDFDMPVKTKRKCEVTVNTKVKTISSNNCYTP